MDYRKIIAAIDEQIGRLQQAKQLLGGNSTTNGRNAQGKRTLSAAARKRIRRAQKARWAKARKA